MLSMVVEPCRCGTEIESQQELIVALIVLLR